MQYNAMQCNTPVIVFHIDEYGHQGNSNPHTMDNLQVAITVLKGTPSPCRSTGMIII